jgi:DNA-binding SARP family transcriptional activator
LQFRILGPLEASANHVPLKIGAAKQRAVVALLLLHPNEVVGSEQLIDGLWGDRPPRTAQQIVRVYVSQLRKLLESGGERPLVTEPAGYLLRVTPRQLDAKRFEKLVGEGRASLAVGDAAAAARKLHQALSLWRGPALADFRYEPFAQANIARLEELRVGCLEDRFAADLALGGGGDLVSELEELVAEHPLRERLRASLMLALYRSGRQADALAAYHDIRRVLVGDLGLEPSPALRDLQAAILRQDPSLEATHDAARVGGSPLTGS